MSNRQNQFDGDSIAQRLPAIDLRRLSLYLLIAGFFAFFVAPIWTGLVTSFKTSEAVTATTPFVPALPGGLAGLLNFVIPFWDPFSTGFTTAKWGRALGHLSRGFVNSMAMAVPATILDVLLGSMAAYGLTMIDWKRKLPILVLFLIGIFIPLQAVLVPLSDFWTNILPLEEVLAPVWALPMLQVEHARLLELMITHVAYGIPICMLLFRSYYNTISTELVEAAKMDGASITKIYTRIVLPLSKPMIGVVLIYQFTQIWNEFLFSLTLIGSSSSPVATITLILSGMGADISGVDFGLRMAGAFLAAMPTLIIYVLFAEQFAKGLAEG